MHINKHIQKLDNPEYANMPIPNVKINLAQHAGKDKLDDYILSQDKDLITNISKMEGVKGENVLITAGADAGLHHVAETFLDRGKIAVIPTPSFGRFEFHVKSTGAESIFVHHARFPFSFDLIYFLKLIVLLFILYVVYKIIGYYVVRSIN